MTHVKLVYLSQCHLYEKCQVVNKTLLGSSAEHSLFKFQYQYFISEKANKKYLVTTMFELNKTAGEL